VWFAHDSDGAVGCSAMINRGNRGQLRWVILLPRARGQGLGGRLTALALDHAQAQGYQSVFLETTDGLAASMTIYQKLGFVTTQAETTRLWHGEGVHIVMERSCLRSSAVTASQSADRSYV
jgi:N-acetylglutamate synthase-like GNAT family acetyltransferase